MSSHDIIDNCDAKLVGRIKSGTGYVGVSI